MINLVFNIPANLQSEDLIEYRIQVLLYGLGLLLGTSRAIRMHLHCYIGITEAIGVHGYQVCGLFDC